MEYTIKEVKDIYLFDTIKVGIKIYRKVEWDTQSRRVKKYTGKENELHNQGG